MKGMVRVYLVRHGETLWNKSLKYQGQKDIPLNEYGRQQAAKVGLRLAGEKIDAVYASDLVRAVETAEAIAGHHNLPVNKLPQLRETNFGCWEGLTYNEIIERYEDIMNSWQEDPMKTRIPDGECLEEVVQRSTTMFWEIVKRHQGEQVALVAHGGTNRIIMAGILGMEYKEYWKLKQDNVCINVIEVFGGDRAILCALNDTCHLN